MISPINYSRISQNLRSELLSGAIGRSSRDMFLVEARLASGRSFVAPSENPVAASQVLNLTGAQARQLQFSSNVRYADNFLTAADGSMTEISGLISEAHSIASQDVSNLTSADERAADAELIAAIRQQLVNVGNRQFGGKYLFAGRDTTAAPFLALQGGVAYLGDTGDLVTRVVDGFSDPINIPGNVLFGALSATIDGSADLSPELSQATRLEDLTGAAGRGIRAGTLVFNEQGGAGVFAVDLQGIDTIGGIAARINAVADEAGAGLTAEMSALGLDIIPGSRPITITDAGSGAIAADLGIRTTDPTSTRIDGQDLGGRLSRLTPVAAMAGGAGIDLDGGLILTSGEHSVTVDISGAETVQDIINAINNSGVQARARINDAGTGLEVAHLVSGAALTIGENGGTTATDLGLRTLENTTLVSQLNFGRGIGVTPNGNDIQITARNGDTFEVDLDGVTTAAEVITAINDAATAAMVNITASLAPQGNGFQLVDASGGTDRISVVSLGESTAGVDLGFVEPSVAGSDELISEDRSGVRPEGVLGALLELESALRRDDTRGITVSAERVNASLQDMIRVHGLVGARSQAMRADLQQMQDAAQTTEIFLSQVRDLDYAEAATQLTSLQTQMQATLQTGANLLSLSLLDFLG